MEWDKEKIKASFKEDKYGLPDGSALRAQLAELLDISQKTIIKHQISQIRDYLTTIGAILLTEGYDVSFNSVWNLVEAKIREQLAGIEKGDELTKEDIDAFIRDRGRENFRL